MIDQMNDEPQVERRCLVCRKPRPVPDLQDAIEHAPCDQAIARWSAPDEVDVGFWSSAGAAGYDHG